MLAPPVQPLARLRQGAHDLGVDLMDRQIAQFDRYRTELLDWNQRVNLTAITEPLEVETRHFLDSLTVLRAIPNIRRFGKPAAVLDVGAGAGFPGVVLAIVLPTIRMTLVESTIKKCRFLEHLVTTLDLPNVLVRCGRAEEFAHDPAMRAAFDVVVARAVAALPALVEMTIPFARVGGKVVCMKKAGIDAEIAQAGYAIKALGGRFTSPLVVRVPFLDGERLLVIVDKVRATSADFPRRTGVPVKSPLIGPVS